MCIQKNVPNMYMFQNRRTYITLVYCIFICILVDKDTQRMKFN